MVVLKEIFDMQRTFDETILKDKNLTMEQTLHKRVFAAIVELGEAANDQQECFKFWKPQNKPKETLLDELADNLHFIPSIGNGLNDIGLVVTDLSTYEYDPVKAEIEENDEQIIEQFIDLYSLLVEVYIDIKRKEPMVEWHYIELMNTYLGLCEVLGFDIETLRQGYITKNEENYARQRGESTKEGYEKEGV